MQNLNLEIVKGLSLYTLHLSMTNHPVSQQCICSHNVARGVFVGGWEGALFGRWLNSHFYQVDTFRS